MKNLKRSLNLQIPAMLMMLALVSVFTLQSKAMGPDRSDASKLGKDLIQMMEYPQELITEKQVQDGIVVISLYLKPNGELYIYKVEGAEVSLNNFVRESLAGKKLPNYLDYELQRYIVPIQFKTNG